MENPITVKEAAELIPCDPKTILNAIHKGKLTIVDKKGKAFLLALEDVNRFKLLYNHQHRLWLNRERIASEYLSGISGLELARNYNVSSSGLYGILYSQNITMRSSSEATRTYHANFRYFENITSEPQAYWLGFIAADGSVNTRNSKYALIINLQLSDSDHLSKFRNAIEGNHPVKIYLKHNTCMLQIHSEKLVNDLAQYGIKPKKCHSLQFPSNIPTELTCHFIRGYFDGDGCIRQGIDRQLRFSIAGNKLFLTTIQYILVQNCQLSYTKISKCHASKSTYQFSYGGNRQVPRILAYLYKDATTYLDRKAKFYFSQSSK